MKFIYYIVGFLVMLAVFFVLCFIGRIVEPLLMLLPQIGKNILIVIFAIAFFVGMNIAAYRESYVTGRRKEWYFWLCLSVTVIFALMMISMGLHDMLT